MKGGFGPCNTYVAVYAFLKSFDDWHSLAAHPLGLGYALGSEVRRVSDPSRAELITA